MRFIGYMASGVTACVLVLIIILVAFTPDKCEHEDMVTMYTFTSYDSTAYSDVRPYCRDCNKRFQYKLFKGTLLDQSYLDAIVEHSDANEIIPGEYYTVTAIVPQGYTQASYASTRVGLNCRVENEDFIVGFNVEFREEFKELVKLVEKGEEITFRGRFYDGGCGFTDCELIIE